MGRKLSTMSMEDLRQEMSIAGSPNKVMEMCGHAWDMIRTRLDPTNPAELINIDLMLRRMQAEIRLQLKVLEKRTGQKYKL
jgi:hypothetical protein